MLQGFKRGTSDRYSKARYLKSPNYSASIIYFGTIYNADNLFIDKEGVDAYWSRDGKTIKAYKIKPTDIRIKWK